MSENGIPTGTSSSAPASTSHVNRGRRATDRGWSDHAAAFDDGGFQPVATAADERRSTYSRWARRREDGQIGRWKNRRELLQRLRQPVIGLTLAGAAGPVAFSARQHQQGQDDSQSPQHASATTAPMAGGDGLEDEVGRRWRAAQEADAGAEAVSDTIQQAAQKYGIAEDLASDIVEAAQKNGIDPQMALGLVKTESTFNHRAVSHVGARGLTQVMPRTAKWLRPGTTAEDLFDRKLNLDLGFGYLRDLLDKYNGNEQLALTAYNRGPGTVDRILKRGGNPDNGYAGKVLRG